MGRCRWSPDFNYEGIRDYVMDGDDMDDDERSNDDWVPEDGYSGFFEDEDYGISEDEDSEVSGDEDSEVSDEEDSEVSDDEDSGSSSQTSSTRAGKSEVRYEPGKNRQPNRKKRKVMDANITSEYLTKDIFSTLPLDLVHEILGHLHPLDLLHLARTCKMLRSYLMSKRSTSTWKNAREAIVPTVPQCPKDQSEPQWAALLFSRDCTAITTLLASQTCGTSQARKVEWTLRLRGCKSCFEDNFYSARELKEALRHVENMGTVLKLVPYRQ
ncbi:hypothetical protein FRC01_011503, partial [Tulasnella sp. 417]